MPDTIRDKPAADSGEELADTLIAISVVAKHLANKIRERSEEDNNVENE